VSSTSRSRAAELSGCTHGGSDAAAGGGSGARLILSPDQWRSDGEALIAGGARIGICLDADDDPAEIAGALDRLALVAVRFPSFADGRGYSIARLLRQRHGWQGELRAVGDVLRDQMFYLSRCGFDTFDLKDGESVADALAGFGDFTESYQSAADHGPLFKRRHRPVLAQPLVAPPAAAGCASDR
jgi:uncharacterized protein (DUF934 family)